MNPNEIPTPRSFEHMDSAHNIALYLTCGGKKWPFNDEVVPLCKMQEVEKELHLANQQVEELERRLDNEKAASDLLDIIICETRELLKAGPEHSLQSIAHIRMEQITKLEAACAEMRKHYIKTVNAVRSTFGQDYGHAMDCDCDRCHDLNVADKFLQSTTSGQRILEELNLYRQKYGKILE